MERKTTGVVLLSPGKDKVRRQVEEQCEWEVAECVRVGSEGELKRELSEIGRLCADARNPEWSKRAAALQRFRGLLVGGAGSMPGFLSLMRENMRGPLNEAIQDLRSAVAKEACWAVMMLCRSLPGHTWESMGDWFLSSLFKISIITIAIISQTSERAIRYIMESSPITPRMRGVILDPVNCENKHSTFRQRVYAAILTAAQRVSPGDWTDRELDALTRTITKGLTDPMPNLRKASRLLYWAFCRIDPGRGKDILESQDAATQRAVLEDRTSYEALVSGASMESSLVSNPHSMGPRRTSSRKAMERPTQMQEGDPGDTIHSASQRSATAQAAPASPGANTPHRRNSQRSTTPLPRKQSRDRLHPVRPHGAPPLDPTDLSADLVEPGAGPSWMPPGGQPGAESGGAVRLVPPATRSPQAQRRPLALPIPRQSSMRDRTGERYSDASQLSTVDGLTGTTEQQEHSSCTSQPSHGSFKRRPGEQSPPTLERALQQSSSQDWAERVNCFEAIGNIVTQGGFGLVRDKIDTVMTLLIDKLADNHFKVVAAALMCALHLLRTSLLTGDEHLLFTHLERLYVGAFGRLSAGSRELTRKAAQDLLERLMYSLHSGRVIPVLLKVFDQSSSKIQLAALEYTWHLHRLHREECAEYFTSAHNVRPCVQKLAAFHGSPGEVKRAAGQCLHGMYCMQPLVFLQAVAASPGDFQNHVKSMLSSAVPSFSEELRAYRTQGPEAAERLQRASQRPTPDPTLATGTGHGLGMPLDSPKPEARRRDNSPAMRRSPSGRMRPPSDSTPDGDSTPLRRAGSGRVGRTLHGDPTVDSGSSGMRRGGSRGSRRDLQRTRSPSAHGGRADRATTAELAWETLADAATSPELRNERASWLVTEWCAERAPWPSETMTQRLCDSNSTGPRLVDIVLDPRNSRKLRCDALHLAARLCPAGGQARRSRFLRDLLRVYLDADAAVSRAAETTLPTVAQRIPPQDAVPLLGSLLHYIIEGGDGLAEARGVFTADDMLPWILSTFEERIVAMGQAFPPEDVLATLEDVLPVLYQGFSSDRAEARKAVVFCFVSLYTTLGSKAVPCMKPLTTSQIKLVTVYINRRRSEQGMGEKHFESILQDSSDGGD
eukprot:Hpha_TRINITY_DN16104_c1_g6::TRINITY_DN16104_c1_g6_i1::g.6699::m.6699/K16578/CLASP1_2; CLIP-associating protein 1/2